MVLREEFIFRSQDFIGNMKLVFAFEVDIEEAVPDRFQVELIELPESAVSLVQFA
jgi:hypothetical protein